MSSKQHVEYICNVCCWMKTYTGDRETTLDELRRIGWHTLPNDVHVCSDSCLERYETMKGLR